MASNPNIVQTLPAPRSVTRSEAIRATKALPGHRMTRLACVSLLTEASTVALHVAGANDMQCVGLGVYRDQAGRQVTIRGMYGGWYVVTLDEPKGGE